MAERIMYTYDEMVEQIKNCGQSIIDNAESILGNERYFMHVTVAFDIYRSKSLVPSIRIERDFTPEKEIENETTYLELKQRKESRKI